MGLIPRYSLQAAAPKTDRQDYGELVMFQVHWQDNTGNHWNTWDDLDEALEDYGEQMKNAVVSPGDSVLIRVFLVLKSGEKRNFG